MELPKGALLGAFFVCMPDLDQSERSMVNSARFGRFLRLIVFGAFGFHLIWLIWGWLISFLAALPIGGTADWLILLLTDGRQLIGFPRQIWMWAWPGDGTPTWLNWLSSILTSLSWGLAFACYRVRCQKLLVFPDGR